MQGVSLTDAVFRLGRNGEPEERKTYDGQWTPENLSVPNRANRG